MQNEEFYKDLHGLLTQKKILSVSKEFFYHYGYTKSTIKMITEEVGISIGSLAYHFKKKEDIISMIMLEYINALYDEINLLTGNTLTTYELHTYASIPYYLNMFNDEKTKAFYYELILCGSPHLQEVTLPDKDSFTRKMSDVFYSSANTSDYTADAQSQAINRQFFRHGRSMIIKDYLENNLKDAPILLVINQISKMMGFCELYTVEYVDQTINKATEFHELHKLEHIKLLL